MGAATNNHAYNSDLNGGSLMVRESRVIAALLLKEAQPEEWVQAIQEDNLLQKRSPATAKRNAQAIRKRLELMSPEFWRALRDGDEELATQVAFCAALERNLLLVEFMKRVLRDAYITHTENLEAYLWTDFLEESAQRDPNIDGWQESTKKKMGQVVFRMLAEVGYLKSTRSLKLQHVLIRAEIKTMLDDNYKQRIKECMEVSYKGNY
ncbi:MAG: DUF1819 family protein [Endozoicomonadaceae bacterium]|nr:DUF1819 family protein [Endozoicomonadaceae bacterium]